MIKSETDIYFWVGNSVQGSVQHRQGYHAWPMKSVLIFNFGTLHTSP